MTGAIHTNSNTYGVSFSIKQCRNFKIDWQDCLVWALNEGWRRFRLMSYWNEIEKKQGEYDFTNLDAQIELIAAHNGVISLCLGVKQPRWPEYHWPSWAKKLSKKDTDKALLIFVATVVNRYKNNPTVIEWQLENEALLSNFGSNIEIDRKRLKQEFTLVKTLDPLRPIIMSTSNGWGMPVRDPIPDIIGFSYYAVMYQKGKYSKTIHRPWLYKIRAWLNNQLLGRPSFIHELQLEPWGHKSIWDMTIEEQNISMSVDQIKKNIASAQKICTYPIDIWGLEWWYWRRNSDNNIWTVAQKELDLRP